MELGAVQNPKLPPLRQDLSIYPIGRDGLGEVVAALYDPVAHKYFELSQDSVALLSHWAKGTAEAVQISLKKAGLEPPNTEEIQHFMRFLEGNNLLMHMPSQKILEKKHKMEQTTPYFKKFSQLLFLKVPLVRPEATVRWLLDFLTPLANRYFLGLTVLAFLLAVYLISQQGEVLWQYIGKAATFQGVSTIFVAIVLLKIAHEFGHAYFATKFGVRVPRMGATFIMGFPLAYTELTDSWRLSSQRSKILIDLGGVIFESVVAAWALLIFAILPDGPARSFCFYISVISMFTTLLINLNPLMRFDGYYVLSDGFKLPNLHTRATAIAVWYMRRIFGGLFVPPPEDFPQNMRRRMAILGVSVLIYRVFLYGGLSAGAFLMLPKVPAILIAAGMIGGFLVRPFVKELGHYWKNRGEVMSRWNIFIWLALLGAIGSWAAWPQPVNLKIPAQISPNTLIVMDAKALGILKSLPPKTASPVEKGKLLYSYEDLDLADELAIAQTELAKLQSQRGRSSSGQQGLNFIQVYESQIKEQEEKITILKAREAAEQVFTPVSGFYIPAPNFKAQEEMLITPGQAFGKIVDLNAWGVAAYLRADQSLDFADAQDGVFVPDDPLLSSVEVKLDPLPDIYVEKIEHEALMKSRGGSVEGRPDDPYRPAQAHLLLRADAGGAYETSLSVVGHLKIEGRRIAPASRLWQRIRLILLRESQL